MTGSDSGERNDQPTYLSLTSKPSGPVVRPHKESPIEALRGKAQPVRRVVRVLVASLPAQPSPSQKSSQVKSW